MKQIVFTLIFPLVLFSQQKEIGQQFINALLVQKEYATAYAYFDDEVKKQISLPVLQQTAEQLESQLGKYKTTIEVNNENTKYFYYSEFEKMKLDINLNFNQQNKLIGFFFQPHKEFNKQTQLGQELKIKSNEIELKGTLLLPTNFKNVVIFIHGSGPNDRDETIYENKPFKDIAEALYNKGIASYRFDKRTYTYPETFKETSTIDDEVTHDILNIINFFATNDEYKNAQIIVLGHSLGGTMLPRIINKSTKISKAIMLAGSPRPLQDLILEQLDYITQLNPTKENKELLETTKTQVKFLNSKKFTINTKEKLPLNLSPYYWNSLKQYLPLQEIQKIEIPIFIAQGERDYQVTMTDFNLWKKTLMNFKNITFKSYPKLNHLFIEGIGKSKPEEYQTKGKVNELLIEDIVNFINP